MAKEKAILTGSPVKKSKIPGGKKQIGEEVHPLKPNFEIQDPDYDLLVRNQNEADRPGSPKLSPNHPMIKSGRSGRLMTPPPPVKEQKSKIVGMGKLLGSAMKGKLKDAAGGG